MRSPIDSSSILQIPAVIVSGGQSGADFGALLAAKGLGIPTGGYAPLGFRTETGPKPELGRVFGLVEHESHEYAPRTRANIELADLTVIISVIGSPERGSSLTERLCCDLGKPWRRLFIASTEVPIRPYVDEIKRWVVVEGLQDAAVWNFAGNRESISPGIGQWTRKLVVALFS